jgi:hypothetical protein
VNKWDGVGAVVKKRKNFVVPSHSEEKIQTVFFFSVRQAGTHDISFQFFFVLNKMKIEKTEFSINVIVTFLPIFMTSFSQL